MRLQPLLVLFAFVAVAAHGQDSSRIYTEIELKERAGVLTLFVPPEYPAEALAKGEGARIDVFGTVGADGAFQLERLEMEPRVDSLEAPVREAARFWMMRPLYDERCMPSAAPAQARIWMEVRDGKPVVAYAKPVEDGERDLHGHPAPKFKRRPKIEYPRYALNRDIQGTMEVVVRVLPDGEVETAHAVPGPLAKVFGPAIVRGITRAEYEPLPLVPPQPVCVVETVSFRILP